MSVGKKERLVLFDFDDEEDGLSVLKKALSEGTAYPVLGIDCVLEFIWLLPSLRFPDTFISNFRCTFLYRSFSDAYSFSWLCSPGILRNNEELKMVLPQEDLKIGHIKCWQIVNWFHKTCKEIISFL